MHSNSPAVTKNIHLKRQYVYIYIYFFFFTKAVLKVAEGCSNRERGTAQASNVWTMMKSSLSEPTKQFNTDARVSTAFGQSPCPHMLHYWIFVQSPLGSMDFQMGWSMLWQVDNCGVQVYFVDVRWFSTIHDIEWLKSKKKKPDELR